MVRVDFGYELTVYHCAYLSSCAPKKKLTRGPEQYVSLIVAGAAGAAGAAFSNTRQLKLLLQLFQLESASGIFAVVNIFVSLEKKKVTV